LLPDIDITASRAILQSFRNKLSSLQYSLEKGIQANRERKEIQARLSKATKLRRDTDIYATALVRLHKKFISEDLAFKDRRLLFLSERITENVSYVFPYEGFKVKVKSDFKNRNSKTTLEIIDKKGRTRLPHINEGKLLQELISFSSAIGINESAGCVIIPMDEAFAASDSDNLGKLAELIELAISKGMQIMMVEQSADGYKNLPRREFRLEKNHATEITSLVEVTDY
jgi:hypothetical protein